MAALPYIQLYVADYLADTSHLSTVQHGAYLLLIMNYWQRGKALKDDNERLANVARMSNEEWTKHRDALEEFFDVVDGEWIHRRIERDLNAVLAKSAKARAAGKASAERKVNARSTNVATNDGHTLNHTDTDTDTDTDINTETQRDAQLPTSSAKKKTVTLKTWLEQIREKGEQAIPADDPLIADAERINLPTEFLRLCWLVFKDRYINEGSSNKKYKDWRAVFRRAVRENWFKLWAISNNGEFYLTNVGKQEQMRLEGA
jgi:uncharacterized protein YdaU (DUF1376 family)